MRLLLGNFHTMCKGILIPEQIRLEFIGSIVWIAKGASEELEKCNNRAHLRHLVDERARKRVLYTTTVSDDKGQNIAFKKPASTHRD